MTGCQQQQSINDSRQQFKPAGVNNCEILSMKTEKSNGSYNEPVATYGKTCRPILFDISRNSPNNVLASMYNQSYFWTCHRACQQTLLEINSGSNYTLHLICSLQTHTFVWVQGWSGWGVWSFLCMGGGYIWGRRDQTSPPWMMESQSRPGTPQLLFSRGGEA